MTAVFRQNDAVATVDTSWIARVKANAAIEPLRRARLNLHHDEADQVQEMVIAFCRDSLIMPHRHSGRSESLHVIEGRALIVFFDDEGGETGRLTIGPPGSGLPPLYRLASDAWHVVIPLDDMLVVHETSAGPFVRNAEPPPPWAPRDPVALGAFIDGLRAGATT